MTSFASGVYQTEFDPSSRDASIVLIEAIADAKNIDSVEVFDDGVTLYEYIDPDALNRLVRNPNVDEVSFTIEENDIQIHSNGIIEIQS